MRCVIGVDLGGTNVRAGAYYEDGSAAGKSYSNPSNAQDGTEAILKSVADTVLQAAEAAGKPIAAVGIAVPGHIDDSAGACIWAPNLGETIDGVFHGWNNVQLREPLERMTGFKIRLGNDANLAALGEYRFGVGRNSAKCLVLLTLGTGVGGGVVFSPQSVQGGDAKGALLFVGGNMGGAELGHVVINYEGQDCNAGEYGSIEGYLGRDAIVRRAQHRVLRGRETILRDMVNGDVSKITPLTIFQAAEKGDELAIEVFAEAGRMLGTGIGNYVNIFAPDVVAIGGQIARAGDYILKPAYRAAQNVAIPSLFRDAKIVIAEQIAEAGILGGAALALS